MKESSSALKLLIVVGNLPVWSDAQVKIGDALAGKL
jgi:hypothetical protein